MDLEDLIGVDTLVSIMGEEERDPSQGPFSTCKPRSTKMPPPGCDEILNTFLFMVIDSLEKLEGSEKLSVLGANSRNMTRAELQALQNLERDTSIIIKAADKGVNLVIMDHTQYRKMCLAIFSDVKGYKVLGRNPTDLCCAQLREILQTVLTNDLIDQMAKSA